MNELEEELRRLPVDLSNLTYAMERAWQTEYHLDLETGEVVTFGLEGQGWYLGMAKEADPGDVLTPLEAAARAMEEEPDRFAGVPPLEAHEKYEQMDAFARSVEDAGVREDLLWALDGKGAFRRFRRVLDRYADVRQAWFRHKDAWLGEEARWWLKGLGVEPVPADGPTEGGDATDDTDGEASDRTDDPDLDAGDGT